MDKIRNIVGKMWKKSYLLIIILAIPLFIFGALTRYNGLIEDRYECTVNKDQHPKEYIEYMFKTYGGLTDEYIISSSIENGFYHLIYIPVFLYGLMLITFLLSQRTILRTIGISLTTITLVLLAGWLWFVANFHIAF